MTQLSFDAGGRLPLLDIMPVSKPGRAGGDPNDQFDSHLNRASSPPPSPGVAPIATASSDSRREQSSAPDLPDRDITSNSSAPAQPSASDAPLQDDKAASSAVEVSEANQAHGKPDKADEEQEHEGEDNVALSAESASLVQQVAVVAAKAELEVNEEATEEVQNIEATKEKEIPTDHDATRPKPKKQVNQAEQSAPANGGNQSAKSAAPKAVAPADVPPAEVPQAAAETSESDATVVAEDAAAATTSEVTEAKPVLIKLKPITMNGQEGEADETDDGAEAAATSGEPEVKGATEEKQSEATDKTATATNATRAANASAEPEAADHSQQPAQFEQPVDAASNEPVLEVNSDSDSASDQQGSNAEQQSEQKTLTAAGSKPNGGMHATSENSPAARQLAPPTEAPLARAENSTPAASSSSGSDSTSAADRARFVHRVYRALHVAHERGGEVRLRLSPPELGNLTLELKLHDGAMTAHIEAETSAARTLLLDNLPALKERLAAQDIKVERFDVELRDQSQQRSPDGQAQDSDFGRSARQALRKGSMNSGKVAEQAAPSGVRATTTSGQLNVII